MDTSQTHRPAPHPTVLGAQALHLEARNLGQLLEALRGGLSTSSVSLLAELLGEDVKTVLGRVRIPWATYSRRRAQGKLDPLESERVMRLARVVEAAYGFFGPEQGRRWLGEPHRTLSGKTPLEYGASEFGAQRVLDLINAARDGLFV